MATRVARGLPLLLCPNRSLDASRLPRAEHTSSQSPAHIGECARPRIHINFVNLAQIGSEPAVAGLLLLLVLVLAVYLYWVAFAPALAAIRLLATRLPPDDVPLPTMMAALEQTSTRPRALPSALTRIAARAQALKAIAYLSLLAAIVVTLWILDQLVQGLPEFGVDPDTDAVEHLLAFLPPVALEGGLILVFAI